MCLWGKNPHYAWRRISLNTEDNKPSLYYDMMIEDGGRDNMNKIKNTKNNPHKHYIVYLINPGLRKRPRPIWVPKSQKLYPRKDLTNFCSWMSVCKLILNAYGDLHTYNMMILYALNNQEQHQTLKMFGNTCKPKNTMQTFSQHKRSLESLIGVNSNILFHLSRFLFMVLNKLICLHS